MPTRSGPVRRGASRRSRQDGDTTLDAPTLVELAGNAGVNRLLAPRIQAKLAVGAAKDPYEDEADRVADALVGGHDPAPPPPAPEAVRRDAQPDEVAASGQAFDASSDVESAITRRRGGGAPLPGKLASEFSEKLGTDLSDVRVHSDPAAGDLAGKLSARAFTHGNDIYFAHRTWEPGSKSGQRLLAHELGHVVQQGGGAQRQAVRRLFDQRALIVQDTVLQTDATKTVPVKKGRLVDVDPAATSTDAWAKGKTKAKYAGSEGWAPRGALFVQHEKAATFDDEEEKPESMLAEASNSVGETTDPYSDFYGEESNKADDRIKDATANKDDKALANATSDKASSDKLGAQDDMAGGVSSSISGFMAIGLKIYQWKTQKKMSAYDKAEAVRDMVGGAGSITSGVSKSVKSGEVMKSGDATDSASAGAADSAEVASFLSGVKKTWDAAKAWWDVFNSKKGAIEKSKDAANALLATLDAASDWMKAAKGLIDILHTSMGNLAHAIPAVGVALNALKIAIRGYEFVQTWYNRTQVRKRKGAIKEELAKNKHGKGWGAKLDNKKIAANKDKMNQLATGPVHDADAASAMKLIGEYEHYKYLQTISEKQLKQMGFDIGAEFVDMAGNIGILTGAGAHVGMGLKMGAAGAKGANKLYLMAKRGASTVLDELEEKKASGKALSRFDKFKGGLAGVIGNKGRGEKAKAKEYEGAADKYLEKVAEAAKASDIKALEALKDELRFYKVDLKEFIHAENLQEQKALFTKGLKSR